MQPVPVKMLVSVVCSCVSFTLLDLVPGFIISCSSAEAGCSFFHYLPVLCCRKATVAPSNVIISAIVTLTVMTAYKHCTLVTVVCFARLLGLK